MNEPSAPKGTSGVDPNRVLTYAVLLAVGLLALFGYCARPDVPPVDPTPTPTYAPVVMVTPAPTMTASVTASVTVNGGTRVPTPSFTPEPPVVRPATATSLPMVRIVPTEPPTATPMPAPSKTPVQRG